MTNFFGATQNVRIAFLRNHVFIIFFGTTNMCSGVCSMLIFPLLYCVKWLT